MMTILRLHSRCCSMRRVEFELASGGNNEWRNWRVRCQIQLAGNSILLLKLKLELMFFFFFFFSLWEGQKRKRIHGGCSWKMC